MLHEAIPITGTLVSGTYDAGTSTENVKTYSHGMFESVYDYPYLSSSANHILDITTGYSSQSTLSSSAPDTKGSSTDQQRRKLIFITKWLKCLWDMMYPVPFKNLM